MLSLIILADVMENEKPINLFLGYKISVYFIKLNFGLCYIPDGMTIYISSQAKCHFYISLHYKQLSETLLTLFFQKRFVAASSDFQQVGKFVNFRFALLVIRNTKRQEFCKITVVIGIAKMCKAMRNNIFL